MTATEPQNRGPGPEPRSGPEPPQPRPKPVAAAETSARPNDDRPVTASETVTASENLGPLARAADPDAMDFLSQLNDEQKRAVLHTDGPLLILAGAGSGKTRVIAHRIAKLIAGGHAEPYQILAVTFTNKAAEEMRGRVARLVDTGGRRPWVSTFHALCARVLRREEGGARVSRDFVIYDSADQLAAMKRLLRGLGADEKLLTARQALGAISDAKNRMLTPAQLREEGWSARGELIAKAWEGYRRALADANALDFDDLLLETVKLFEKDAAVRSRYGERFRFVMVDEYQDTNPPQYRLVRLLTDGHRNLCVVGDPDQSIYKWRGADLRNILDFKQHFPEATEVRLEQNYRSTQVILDAAGAVIRRNRNRPDKRLWTDRAGGDLVRCFRGGDELEEADFVTDRLRETLAARETPAGVLYRTNAQSRALEDALTREGIDYRIVGSVRFYERKEIKDALAYLRLMINPDDDVSLRRVVNTPPRGIGDGTMTALEALAPEPVGAGPLFAGDEAGPAPPDSLWRRVNRAVDEGLLPTRAVAALRRFRDLIRVLAEIAASEPVSDLLGKLLDRSGYLQALRDESTEEAEGRLDNLKELVSAARDYEIRETEASLTGFVDRLSLLSETDEAKGSEEAGVWLMTLHAAKGLEFPVVFMVGLEEGLFPHMRARDDDEELEEERRLCYVGMTRAQTRLVLTSARRRRVFGEYQDSEPSRFLDEIPPELVDHVEPVFSTPVSTAWRQPFRGRSRSPEPREEIQPDYGPSYEDEDQSAVSVAPGARVRHPKFGVGTVLSVEPLTDDMKLTVSFRDIGRKTLRAKFAKLTMA